jgi:hypothetical protein
MLCHVSGIVYDPLSGPSDSDLRLKEKLDRLESVVKAQEQRIRLLESGPLEIVRPDGGGGEGDLTERERKVMEFIIAKPNVTKQDVVDRFKGRIARVPVFNTIDSLVRCGIIEDNPDSKNRQVHRLTLNQDSTFYSVLVELNQFKKSFKQLVEKIVQEKMKILAINPSQPKDEYFELVAQAYIIFDSMLFSYLVRYVHLWSKEFHDRQDVLNKLIAIVLARIAEINESLPDTPVENIKLFRDVYLVRRLQGTENLKLFVSKSEKFGLTKEMEPVLDALWNINRQIQKYAYPEPRLFFWEEFEYGKDDWRKLLEVVKKHPDKDVNKTKTPIDGLLNKPLEIK